jgi:glycerophosphoryl diester phosphodiesterase
MAGFKLAIDIGVTTLETDLALTKDGVLILSHDPVLNPDLTRDSSGRWLETTGPAIQSLTAAELQQYDIGRLKPDRPYTRQYPQQKPADGERFPTVAEFLKLGGPAMRFNIEIKIDPNKPALTPDPARFAAATVAAVRAAGAVPRTIVQSFDWRAVIEMRRQAPEIETACLTIESNNFDTVRRAGPEPSPWLGGLKLSDHGGSLPRLVKAAGCSTWSLFWRNVTPELVAEAQALGLKVIPWTVNDPTEMGRLVDLKVDGLITDYPDRAQQVLQAKGIKLR